MKTNVKKNDDLRPEYDFDYSKAVRGKYYHRILKEGTNVVVLDSDLAKVFVDSKSVNNALRHLLNFNKKFKALCN